MLQRLFGFARMATPLMPLSQCRSSVRIERPPAIVATMALQSIDVAIANHDCVYAVRAALWRLHFDRLHSASMQSSSTSHAHGVRHYQSMRTEPSNNHQISIVVRKAKRLRRCCNKRQVLVGPNIASSIRSSVISKNECSVVALTKRIEPGPTSCS